jgi:hypothetical protein
MAGFIPAIHVLSEAAAEKAWMAGTSPAMTKKTHVPSAWERSENTTRIFGQALRSIAQRCVSKDEINFFTSRTCIAASWFETAP